VPQLDPDDFIPDSPNMQQDAPMPAPGPLDAQPFNPFQDGPRRTPAPQFAEIKIVDIYEADDEIWKPACDKWVYKPSDNKWSNFPGVIRRGQSRRTKLYFAVSGESGYERANTPELLRVTATVFATSRAERKPRAYRWVGLAGTGEARTVVQEANGLGAGQFDSGSSAPAPDAEASAPDSE
jgi:hypothetical protein